MMYRLNSRSRFNAEYTGAIMVFLMAVIMTLSIVTNPYDKHGENVELSRGVFSIVLWIILAIIVYQILKIPRITITENEIIFKSVLSTRSISWKDVETIILTGKRPLFWRNNEEATSLLLKTGEKVFISVRYYKNAPQIRRLLNNINAAISMQKPVTIDPLIFLPLSKTKHIIPQEEVFFKYAGTPYLNVNAIIFYGASLGLVVGTWSTILRYPERLPLLVIPIMVFYLAPGVLLNYFLVSDKYIVVKNAFWFWRKHIYAMDEIVEVVFEYYDRGRFGSNALRIITADFRSKIYSCAGLWAKDWKKLKAHLESRNVRVRNELTSLV